METHWAIYHEGLKLYGSTDIEWKELGPTTAVFDTKEECEAMIAMFLSWEPEAVAKEIPKIALA